MHYTTLAAIFLPTMIAAAADFQVTHWVCANGEDGGDFEQDSVRTGSQSGCSGCNLIDDGTGDFNGGNPAEDCARNFNYAPQGSGYAFGVTYSNRVATGQCYPSIGNNDVCNQASYACSITVLYDCYID